MTQALFTSMTGLNAGTEQLTVVSDNVANMNTTAYKTSRLDFQDIWYSTKTTGTNSTVNSGGTNPYQVGVGVQCAGIVKDFSASSTNTTGRTDDMAITGAGWFTVMNSDGMVMLTRDGTFSLDENGFLCTANGCKVLGMGQQESMINSTVPIKMPTSIKVVEAGTPVGIFEDMFSNQLNALGSTQNGFTDGKFTVIANAGGKQTEIPIDLNKDGKKVEAMTMGDIAAQITGQSKGKFSVEVKDGVLQWNLKDDTTSLEFATIAEKDGGSNIIAAAELRNMTFTEDAVNGNYYTTKLLNISATVGEVDDITSEYTRNYDRYSVGIDGLVTVTYDDGSTLTVRSNEAGTTYFSYENANGVIINGDPTNSAKGSLYVDENMLTKANMQMQMAKVLNDGGLIAEGNNMYSVGVNCGQVIYSAANTNGIGGVITGALESSNVDLAQQFSNMILAQRLVQANSQVFSGANSLLETLVYLGN